MKKKTFSPFLILVFLFAGTNLWAQVTKTINGTVKYESGASTTTLPTSNGNVVVKLPALSGNVISGTVSVEPAGNTDKEKKRNLKELLNLSLMLGGQKIPIAASPQTFNWLSHLDRPMRTAMELFNSSGTQLAAANLPPVLPAPAIVSGGNTHLSCPSKILVQGDALYVYTDQQYSPVEKFTLTDSKGRQFTLSPVCLSQQQAVMNVPQGASPGKCVVSRQLIDQPNSNTGVTSFTIMGMDLSSPNTNLRRGEVSNVLVQLNTGTGVGFKPPVNYEIKDFSFGGDNMPTDYPGIYSIDIRNLNPNVVTMEGGNLQRVYSNNHNTGQSLPNEPATGMFQVKRNITGNVAGSFSVSATLHEDYNTSTDPFRPQENVLQTPQDFNNWANALKKDLAQYASIQANNVAGQAIKANAQKAIDNMPVCANADQLDESKAIAYTLVQPLHVPKGAAINWLSSYEAAKAAAGSIDNNVAGNTTLTDYDVIKNGVEFINRIGAQLKDPALQTQCRNTQQLINDIQTGPATKENLQELKNAVNVLTAKADMKIETDEPIILKTPMKDLIMSSLQLPSLAPPGRPHPVNDLACLLDPKRKVLMVAPGHEQMVLNEYNAVKLADGHFQVSTVTAFRKPVNLTVSLLKMPALDIFLISKEMLDSIEKIKAWVDSANRAAAADSIHKGAMVWIDLDSINATWSRIFLDSKCVEIKPACKGECVDYSMYQEYKYDSQGRLVLVQKYNGSMKIECPAVKECQRTKVGQCQEILTFIREITTYTGPNCKTKIESHTEGLQFICK